MGKAAYSLLLGAFMGIQTLLCTYIIGTIHNGFYLAIVKLEWWVICLSVLPALIFLTVATFRFNKNIKHILISSITSGIAFMLCGWIVLWCQQPIINMYYHFFPTNVYHRFGYPSQSYVLYAGFFLIVIVLSHLIVIRKKRY